MKNKLKISILLTIILILTASVSILFGVNNAKTVNAASFSTVKSALTLTGLNGYSPEHYFDSLSGTKVSSNTYSNRDGKEVSTYYTLTPSTDWELNGKGSYGSSNLELFGDYISLAESGSLYAYISCGVCNLENKSNSNITLTLSHNGQTKTVTNTSNGEKDNSVYKPVYISTELVKVKASSPITFSFSNNSTSCFFNKADFIIFEPQINFVTISDYVELKNKSQTVYPNEVIELSSSNTLLSLSGNSNFLTNIKNHHKISYEITFGNSNAQILGNYLYITSSSSGYVKVRAKCLSSSQSTSQYVYSEEILFTIDANQIFVTANQNFVNASTISGAGNYFKNQYAYLTIQENPGYTFQYWQINNSKDFSRNVNVKVEDNLNIEAYFVKDIAISNIVVAEKEYDGTTVAEITNAYLSGIEHQNVELNYSNLSATFCNKNAEFNKHVIVRNTCSLTGENACWYNLSETLPEVTSSILKRDTTITPDENLTKNYGDLDPVLTFTYSGFVGDESPYGSLSREIGENVGNYLITSGTMTAQNPNYNINIIKSNFIISKRPIFISNTYANNKEYNGNSIVECSFTFSNTVNNCEINVTYSANFTDANVGVAKNVFVTNIALIGEEAKNYYLASNTSECTGTITAKQIEVILENSEKIYNSTDPKFVFFASGLIESDTLDCTISRQSGEDVGKYKLFVNLPETSNYSVITNNAYLTISKLNVTVVPNSVSKVYGDLDPQIQFSCEEISTDSFLGSLSRQSGEQIGNYLILINNLSNPNLNITLTQKYFEITKRQAIINLSVNNKTYDGTNNVTYTYSFSNLSVEDTENLILKCTLMFHDCNVNERIPITIESFSVSGTNSENYNFNLNSEAYFASITRKNVTITPTYSSKIYGEADPAFPFVSDGLINEETLSGALSRISGENVGDYSILLGTISNSNNKNYNISLVSNGDFKITKRNLKICINNPTKIYGEVDPTPAYSVCEGTDLAFSDNLSDILTGSPIREEGETFGIYNYRLGTLKSNNNYNLTFANSYLTIIKRPIEITINNCTKIYGEVDPVITYNLVNTLPTDSVQIAFTRDYGENVGVYSISNINLIDNRYELENSAGTLTITPRSIQLKADTKVKIYGDSDPQFSLSITNGILVNNDTLPLISNGNPQREIGEDVGIYAINQGNLTLNNNYSLSFVPGSLTIRATDITITAKNSSKEYSTSDPQFSYEVTSGKLLFNDSIIGKLSREEGEEIGIYEITLGTLFISGNYNITFNSASFSIFRKTLHIYADLKQKTYGDDDPTLSYTLNENLKVGDSLTGMLYRESGENIGNYSILSTLSNPKYEIIYHEAYLTITKRIINIEAGSFTKYYGESDPTLCYNITSGSILSGDSISGSIYRVQGESVGIYDIRSSLSINKNYKIVFSKGQLEIMPLNLSIQLNSATKVYGEVNEELTYSIVSGELINQDKLSGIVSREPGKNVGRYKIICELFNTNYNIFVNKAYLTITQKDVNLVCTVSPKIFDGTTIAYIKSPVVTGLIDSDVVLAYDKNNCANFDSASVGNNKPITLHNITLSGENAKNYNLVYPSELYGNITNSMLANNDSSVIIYANNNTNLIDGSVIVTNAIDKKTIEKDLNKTYLTGYAMQVVNNNENVNLSSEITLKIKVDANKVENIYVYKILDNGNYELVKSNYENGYVTFTSSNLTSFVIVSDSTSWVEIMFAIMVLIIVLLIVYINRREIFKRLYAKKQNN